MKINFLNQYFKSKASDNNASDLLNMYLEEDKDLGKYKIIALPTPGKTVFNSDSGSVVRGGIEHQGVAYFVVDNKFYSYASNGTRTLKGTLNSSTGQVQLASIKLQICIIDGTDIYVYDTYTTTFTIVSDLDKPAYPFCLAAQDEFFLISSQYSSIVYGSDIADGTSWNALSFSTKTGQGDHVNGLISNKEVLHVFGQVSSDNWYNSGATTFSFEPIGLGGFFHYGCVAKNSVCRGKDTVFFLGQNENGGYCVLVMDQYKATPVSTRAIDYQLSLLTSVSDAIAYTYRQAGHEFYVLVFPTDAKSFMYDNTSGIWSELQSYVSGQYTRDLGNCHVFCYGKNLVGAFNSGTIYYLDPTVYQENGTAIKRRVVTPPGYADGKKVYMDRLQVDVQTGVGSSMTVELELSKDAGQTFTSFANKSIPLTGGRLFWYRLGMTQSAFVVRLTTTANAKFIILGAQAEIRQGIH